MSFFTGLPGFCIAMFLLPTLAWSQEQVDWDSFDDPDRLLRDINEGELNFLEKKPDKNVHHHQTKLVVLPDSIRTGWVKLLQCHENLDKFPKVQIVYHKDRIRKLELISWRNMEDARVEGATIQLTDTRQHARLCIKAESKALISQPDGTFIIQNGPFMRKFLDGYFPMRVSMDVRLPHNLVFTGIEPVEQQGFKVTKSVHGVRFDAWFEGRLTTRIKLKRLAGAE